ncbi:hypothetical protein [Spiroplasma endosymbiont of Othius punctulatus]|uniref:hypothetical protein n=1 Tax=Spiroplasma endosymbiont of Othius punctulatus TaxID=3066289 RepID=UPI0030D59ADC
MKNKWKLILIFFISIGVCSIAAFSIKIPIYKPIQFNSIKVKNTYKFFISLNNIESGDVKEIKLTQGNNVYLIETESIKFEEDGTAELNSIDKQFEPNEQTKAVAVLKSERIMYYLFNRTFSRK